VHCITALPHVMSLGLDRRGVTIGKPSAEDGFSLLELISALAITLVIGGAIVGLFHKGAASFRQEPALAELHQNVRQAMDAIAIDVASSGEGITGAARYFSPGLDGVGAPGPSSMANDELELLTTDIHATSEEIAVASSSAVILKAGATALAAGDVAIILRPISSPARVRPWLARRVTGTTIPPPGTIPRQVALDFSPGDASGLNDGDLLCGGGALGADLTGCAPPVELIAGDVIRYRIRRSAGVDRLERSSRRRANDGFVVIADGIEEMQIRYAVGPNATWQEGPPGVTTSGDDVVTLMEVTLTGRALAPRIEGELVAADGSTGRRITERRVIAVRSGLLASGVWR
jgi:hypothetical protein